jgi:alanine racemase
MLDLPLDAAFKLYIADHERARIGVADDDDAADFTPFSAFDKEGIPTHNHEGDELSKKQRKRLLKRFRKFQKRVDAAMSAEEL